MTTTGVSVGAVVDKTGEGVSGMAANVGATLRQPVSACFCTYDAATAHIALIPSLDASEGAVAAYILPHCSLEERVNATTG